MTFQKLLEAYGGKPYWWKWKNFQPKEVACKCCGELWRGSQTFPPEWFLQAMDALQRLRDQWGRPIIINSGHRCAEHNGAVGGVADSQHLTHIAFDCRCPKEDQKHFEWIAENAGFRFTLRYPDRGFVHVDMRAGK